MRQFLITTTLLFVYFISVGQTKTISIPINSNGDTTYWYSWLQKYYDKEFFSLIDKSDSFHVRISDVSTAIDIWTNNYKTFKGTVTAFIKCVNFNKAYTFKTLSKTVDTAIARRIYNIINNNKILDIPTDNKIPGWTQGLDGNEILVEYSTPTFYSLKEYWTPYIFKQIKQAQVIDTVQKQVNTLISDIHFSNNLLSKGCSYQYSGIPGVQIKFLQGVFLLPTTEARPNTAGQIQKRIAYLR